MVNDLELTTSVCERTKENLGVLLVVRFNRKYPIHLMTLCRGGGVLLDRALISLRDTYGGHSVERSRKSLNLTPKEELSAMGNVHA